MRSTFNSRNNNNLQGSVMFLSLARKRASDWNLYLTNTVRTLASLFLKWFFGGEWITAYIFFNEVELV